MIRENNYTGASVSCNRVHFPMAMIKKDVAIKGAAITAKLLQGSKILGDTYLRKHRIDSDSTVPEETKNEQKAEKINIFYSQQSF